MRDWVPLIELCSLVGRRRRRLFAVGVADPALAPIQVMCTCVLYITWAGLVNRLQNNLRRNIINRESCDRLLLELRIILVPGGRFWHSSLRCLTGEGEGENSKGYLTGEGGGEGSGGYLTGGGGGGEGSEGSQQGRREVVEVRLQGGGKVISQVRVHRRGE